MLTTEAMIEEILEKKAARCLAATMVPAAGWTTSQKY